jgi:hypothetical protein
MMMIVDFLMRKNSVRSVRVRIIYFFTPTPTINYFENGNQYGTVRYGTVLSSIAGMNGDLINTTYVHTLDS